MAKERQHQASKPTQLSACTYPTQGSRGAGLSKKLFNEALQELSDNTESRGLTELGRASLNFPLLRQNSNCV